MAYASTPVWEQSNPDAIIQYILQPGRAQGRLGRAHRAQGGRDLGQVPDRRVLLPGGPDPQALPARRSREDVRGLPASTPRASTRPQTNRITPRAGRASTTWWRRPCRPRTASAPPSSSSTAPRSSRTSPRSAWRSRTACGCMEELRNPFGLVLVTAPVFNGANTTAYSIMNFLVRGQRDVVSLEAPVLLAAGGRAPGRGASRTATAARMEETLRSVVAVRPEVLVLSSVPDRAHRRCWRRSSPRACWWSRCCRPRPRPRPCRAFLQLGVPPQVLAGSLAAVTCQRLVRQICRICRQPAEPPAPQTLAHHGISAEEARDAAVLPRARAARPATRSATAGGARSSRC